MWVFLSNAFLSIVSPQAGRGVDPRKFLIVRARIGGDIQRAFPGYRVVTGKGTDYRFRAVVPRDVVAKRLADEALSLTYTNFKDSTKEKFRHDAYMNVWLAMMKTQHNPRHRQSKPQRGGPIGSRHGYGEPDDNPFWDWQNSKWAGRFDAGHFY